MQTGKKDGAFHLRGRHRQWIDNRNQLAGSAQRQRQRFPAGLDHLKAHLHQRPEHAAHRTPRQRGVPRHLDRDRMSGDDAHHQARTGAGIAEIERLCGLAKSAGTAPLHFPHVAALFSVRTQGRDGARRVHDVFGLEKAANACRSGRQRPENQGAVRNRFVAGEPDAALQRRRTHHGKGLRSRGFQDRKSRLRDDRRAERAHDLRADMGLRRAALSTLLSRSGQGVLDARRTISTFSF